MKKKINLTGTCKPIILLYLAISHCMYLLPSFIFNYGIGNLYDILFLLYFFAYLKENNFVIKIEKEKKVIGVYFFWLCYVALEAVFAIKSQSIFESMRGGKEMFMFLSVLFLFDYEFDGKHTLKILVFLETIGSFLFIVQAISGFQIMQEGFTKLSIFGIIVNRSYADIPVFGFFIMAVLVIGLIERKAIISKKSDLVLLVIIVLGLTLRYTRGIWYCEILVLLLSITFAKTRGNVTKKIIIVLLLGTVLLYIVPKYFSNITSHFFSAFEQMQMNAGNGALRTNDFQNRWNYLKEHNRLLFGMGCLGPDYILPGYNGYYPMVKTSDISYCTILIRYGLVGTVFYVSLWLYIAWNGMKKSMYGKAFAIYIFMQLILGIDGYTLCESGLMKLALLYAVVLKVSEQENL